MFNYFFRKRKKSVPIAAKEQPVKKVSPTWVLLTEEVLKRIDTVHEQLAQIKTNSPLHPNEVDQTHLFSQADRTPPNEPAPEDGTLESSRWTKGIDSIEHVLKEGDESIGLMTELIFSMSQLSMETEKSIHYLVETINDIYNIVQSIQTISNNTTLISLNASIEANRGDGETDIFKVIASEIRKLADKTKLLTNEILSFKEKIDAEAKGTKQMIAEEHILIRSVVEQIDVASASFQHMANSTIRSEKDVKELLQQLSDFRDLVRGKHQELAETQRINRLLKDNYHLLHKKYMEQQQILTDFLASKELKALILFNQEGYHE